MFCNRCRNPIPDNLLACPVCTDRDGDQTLMKHQLAFLERVAHGDWRLVTYRNPDGKQHIRLFGSDRGYCGEPLTMQRKLRKEIQYTPDDLANVCAACRISVRKLMEEVQV